MRLSRYFLPVLKENPAEAQIVSHRYMLRAGMIKQQAAGIYSWLPLGFKVLRKIENIVHEEQQRAGHVPMLMPTLQSADLWRESGRYDDYGPEMLRIQDRHERDMLYGPTNEEQITEIFAASARTAASSPIPAATTATMPWVSSTKSRCAGSGPGWRSTPSTGRGTSSSTSFSQSFSNWEWH